MKKFLTLLILVVFAAWNSYGAVATGYTWSQNAAGTYTAVAGGTLVASGALLDDNTYSTLPIGFTFYYNGNAFTQFGCADNGFMQLGGAVVANSYGVFVGGVANAIAAFNGDLEGTASAELRYVLSGTTPNQVLTIQWKDYRYYGDAGTTANFQIKLYETTNTVEICYGSCLGSTTQHVVQVGISGNPGTDYNIRAGYAAANSWTTSIPSPGPNYGIPVKDTWYPPSGLIFSWVEVAPGPAAVVSPLDGATGVNPSATLNWSAPTTGGLPDGYRLYFGTDNPPTNIVNGTNLGTVLTYAPAVAMTLNTVYHWQVVPFNGGGAAANPVWSFTVAAGFGSLEGFVTNCYGVPVAGATVAAVGGGTYSTTSAANGFYQFPSVSAGTYTVTATKVGYNTTTITGVAVNNALTTTLGITMTQPAMTVLPNPNIVTLNPNELLNNDFTITNAGCGPLTWTATVAPGASSWFSMPTLTGTVNASTNVTVPAIFNANGLAVGTIMSTTVTFTSNPNIGSFTVPVNMAVAGEALTPVTNLTGVLTDPITGAVSLAWDCTPSSGFLYYVVKRNGVQQAIVPSATNFSQVLPTYGVYSYEVAAVYTNGMSAPATVSIEWANPTMTWTPASLLATVWTGTEKTVPLTIGNTGEGTLAFAFPDYMDNSGDSPLAYCAAAASVCDEFIGRVQFANLDHSSACNYYSDFTVFSTDLEMNSPTAMTVTNGGNPYSSDAVYVWIDFNHNNTFDAAELTTLTSNGTGSSFAGNITVPLTAMPGITTMRVRMSYATAADPCGTQTYGEVEDYSVNLKAPSFITSVTPASGIIPGGAPQVHVQTIFSATGPLFSPPGTYNTILKLTSNDLANPAVNIPATMIVTVPGTLGGTVTDCVSGAPIPGVLVTAGTFSSMTDDNGEYMFLCDAGTYDLTFSKIGYQGVSVTGAIVVAGATTTVDAAMCEQPYAPSCASASVNATDTQSTVTWCLPAGPYELLYDDGSAENFASWQLPGNMNAVKFTPRGYPSKVVGAKLFVGDGSFPIGGNIMNAPFTIAIQAADGANGMPGTMLDSVPATVTNFGWVDVTGLNANVTAGDFYVVMIQRSQEPNCAPIGIDASLPKAYKSYSRNVTANQPWILSPYQDFMMHAVVSGPISGDDAIVSTHTLIPGKVTGMISQSPPNPVPGVEATTAKVTAPDGYAPDAVSHYKLWRLSGFVPCGSLPGTSVYTLLNDNLTATTYIESGAAWANLPMGWYAYAVKAVYPNGQESDYVYTNAVPHKLFADVTVNAKLICGMVPAQGAVVTFVGSDCPYDVLSLTVPASGTVVFDNMIKGHYEMTVTYGGYSPYVVNYNITGDRTIDVVMEDMRYVPRNLFVDDRSLVATWDPPIMDILQQDFESGIFPPSGWQATTSGAGWFGTTNGSSSFFNIPGHTTYAVSNDDANSTNNGCCDYLITPELNLTTAPSFVLSFQSFYNGAFGELAYVEMSIDAGATWTSIYTVTAANAWQQVDVDLSAYSGTSGLASVWFAFHADDGGTWASGWAVDDVSIVSGALPNQGYGVFLDASLVGNTPDLTWTYDPATIHYGQTYVAGVAAIYCSGYSALDTYTFTAHFLYPPRNLQGTPNQSAAILTWQAPLSGDFAVTGSIPRTSMPDPNTEYSPMITQHTGSDNSAAMWDVLMTWTPTTSHAGCVTDGNFIYTSAFGGTTFSKLDLSGNWVEDFTIPGVTSIRDMAFDGTHVYGSDASANLREMDFTNKVLVNTVTVQGTTGVRHIAYDPTLDGGNGGFWVGAWADAFMIKRDGSNLGAVPGFNLSSCYGSAYDNTTAGGPYIWYFDQGGNGADIYQYSTTSMSFTGVVQDASTLPGFIPGSYAGGLDYSAVVAPGKAVLIGVVQNAVGFEYELSAGVVPPPTNNFLSYNLYRDNALYVSIPKTELSYWDTGLTPATYCYDITAVYDLAPYGLPGTDESLKEGTACVPIAYGYLLPFVEDWTSGTFSLNQWTAGPNWVTEGQIGNPLPSAKFKWDPLLTNYTSSLESFWLDATQINSTTPYKIWADFDLKLDDRTASTNEKLDVDVWNGSSWVKVSEVVNNGDFDWTAQHVDITNQAKNKVFRLRFRANGAMSGDIMYWYVDNINIYVKFNFNPPINLVSVQQGTPKDDVKLTWGAPAGGGTIMTYVIDDNTAENGWAINPGYESWLGNEFVVTETGVIQSFDLWWQSNASAGTESLTVDIFDGSQTLVGSSAAFVPVNDDWMTVSVADVPFSGTFYAMVHWNMLAGQTNYLGSDENGPNAAANYGWYFDGSAWSHLSDFGYNPNVFLLRAKALVGGDKSVVTFGPASSGTGATSTVFANAAVKSNHGGSTGSPVMSSAVSNGDNSAALTGYNVYRWAYTDPIPGQYTTLGDTTKIATTDINTTEYLDANLFNNCYFYYVTAAYTEGESVPSNTREECLTVGINNLVSEVKLYPNPAITYVNIDLTKDVRHLAVYNALGSVVAEQNITRETSVKLNTVNYAAGVYSVKFTTANGNTFSRKFVVTK